MMMMMMWWHVWMDVWMDGMMTIDHGNACIMMISRFPQVDSQLTALICWNVFDTDFRVNYETATRFLWVESNAFGKLG